MYMVVFLYVCMFDEYMTATTTKKKKKQKNTKYKKYYENIFDVKMT